MILTAIQHVGQGPKYNQPFLCHKILQVSKMNFNQADVFRLQAGSFVLYSMIFNFLLESSGVFKTIGGAGGKKWLVIVVWLVRKSFVQMIWSDTIYGWVCIVCTMYAKWHNKKKHFDSCLLFCSRSCIHQQKGWLSDTVGCT